MASEQPWCVQHQDGWCATWFTHCPHGGYDDMPTRCKHYVLLPWGYEQRAPDCPDCREELGLTPWNGGDDGE